MELQKKCQKFVKINKNMWTKVGIFKTLNTLHHELDDTRVYQEINTDETSVVYAPLSE